MALGRGVVVVVRLGRGDLEREEAGIGEDAQRDGAGVVDVERPGAVRGGEFEGKANVRSGEGRRFGMGASPDPCRARRRRRGRRRRC
jgi:hypothetical protein